ELGNVDTPRAEPLQLLEEDLEVDNDTVADDGHAARGEDAGGQQVQGIGLVVDDNCVPGVVSAVELHDVVDLGAELVGGLAFALIPPLGSEHHNCWHEVAFLPVAGPGGNRGRAPASGYPVRRILPCPEGRKSGLLTTVGAEGPS